MKIQVAFYGRYFGRYYYSLLFFIILYSRRAAGQINICNNILHYCELMVFSPVIGEFSPPASSSQWSKRMKNERSVYL